MISLFDSFLSAGLGVRTFLSLFLRARRKYFLKRVELVLEKWSIGMMRGRVEFFKFFVFEKKKIFYFYFISSYYS